MQHEVHSLVERSLGFPTFVVSQAADRFGIHTFRRYSTARSGLLNAALIARSICDLSKPILSRFAIAADRSAPSVKADGSLKLPPSAVVPVVAVDAGVGVDGTSAAGFDAGAGAGGGAAGVDATAACGVDGAAAEEDAVVEVAGAALGCSYISA